MKFKADIWMNVLMSKLNKFFTLSSCILAGMVLAGCSVNKLPMATIHEVNTTSLSDYQYIVGPGDQLNIFVWKNEDLSGSFLVRPDGKISTSLVEDILVSGKTPTQVAREVERVLGVYLKDPIVTVSVDDFQGPYYEQVRIVGAAATPSAINYRQNMTLLDAMIQVQGLSEFADGNGATLIRLKNGEFVEYELNIDDLLNDGDIRENVDILPGDIIVIPETWF